MNFHFSSMERLLPEATRILESRDTSKPAFFFVETSCDGVVNARQACAVESAALLHPEADVYLLLLSPPANLDVSRNTALKHLTANYPNVRVAYFHLEEYFKNSRLEQWYKSGLLRASSYQQSHTSDAFR
jgi:lactosylceramide 4-alpha-galactosyltransferase